MYAHESFELLAPHPAQTRLAPTFGAADTFCSANGTPVFDGFVRPSVTVVGGLVRVTDRGRRVSS